MSWKKIFSILLLNCCFVSVSVLQAEFTDITREAGVGLPQLGAGLAVADFNQDGLPDFYVVNQGENSLYENQSGIFQDIAAQAGVTGNSTSQATGALALDYNNDGWPDLLTWNPLVLYKNLGNGRFADVSATSNVIAEAPVMAAAPGDYNGDGLPDIYLVLDSVTEENMLLENSGPPRWQFINRSSVAKVNSRSRGDGAIFFDYNNDGRADLYVINKNAPNQLYENQGNGTFVDVAVAQGVAQQGLFTGVTTADYDNDGDFDLYLTVAGAPNLLLQNSGAPSYVFRDKAATAGVAQISNGYTAAFGDYDNDSWQDLYVSSGFENDALYRNLGDGTFRDVALSEEIRKSGGEIPAFFDLDNDGQLDVYIVNALNENVLYRNTGNSNHWLKIQVVGQTATRQAFGVQVRLLANGVWQSREINGQSPGAYAGHALPEHFGLGAASVVDSLEILWPDGRILALNEISADQLLIIPEQERLPGRPQLLSPENQTITNQNQPIFQWQAMPDANGDSLHFVLEIASDPAFSTLVRRYNSAEDATGFSIPLPAVSSDELIQFTLPQPLPDGVYWWRVQAHDGLGSSAAFPPFQLTVDMQLPENPSRCLEQGGADNGVWQNRVHTPVFQISAPDSNLAGYFFYWGPNPAGESTAFQDSTTFRFNRVADGTYFFRVRTQDLAGNLAPVWQTLFTFRLDQTPPTGTTAMSVALSDTASFYIHWENTGEDSHAGISENFLLQVQTDGGVWLELPIPVVGNGTFYTGEPGHRYGFEVVARDNAGNWEAFSGTAESVTEIDPTAPDIYPPPPPLNLAANGTSPSPWQASPEFEITWEEPYDRSGIERCFFKVGDPPQANFDTTGSVPPDQPIQVLATKENGQWCYLWLQDRQGNRDYHNRSKVWLQWDQTAPIVENVALTSPHFGDNWYNPNHSDSLAVEFTFREQRPQTAMIWLDGMAHVQQPISAGTKMPVSLNFAIASLEDGQHEFEVVLQDSAGNQSGKTGEFRTDKSPPTGTHTFSPAISNTQAFKVSWFETGVDPGAGLAGSYDVFFQENDGPWQRWLNQFKETSAQFTGEQGARYAFEVAAYDNVGNREVVLGLPESKTRVDTTQQLSAVPPEQTLPYQEPFLNAHASFLKWRIPVDLNGDALHFKIELALDSLFQQNPQVFESRYDLTGFLPAPPLAQTDSLGKFQLPLELVDGIYWWRVRAWDGQFYGQPSAPHSFLLDTVLPENPVTCADSSGAPNNRWQNQFNEPFFFWNEAADSGAGLAGYQVYFGQDSAGATAQLLETNQFTPGRVVSGRHFLRVRSQDRAGNLADWTTLFIFKYDSIPPQGTTARSAAMSDGPTFPIYWTNTGVDSGGSGFSGLFDVWMRKDTTGTWASWLGRQAADTVYFTGEPGHHYSFEVAAWDSAGNREVILQQPETTILCAPVNAPPAAPVLLEPVNRAFISRTGLFRWTVPADSNFNPLHFKIEFSPDSLFRTILREYESKSDTAGFTQAVAAAGSGDVGFLLPQKMADGDYWWRVSAWDGWVYGPVSQPGRFVLDQTGPEIFAVEMKNTVFGNPARIEFTARDTLSGVLQTRAIYRVGGNLDSLVSVDLEIPAEMITTRGLEYAMLAIDNAGNYRRQPASGFLSLPVFVDGDGIVAESEDWRFGETPQAYRMVSVPLLLSEATPARVLSDDFGAYDTKKWRLFDFENSQFREFQNIPDGFSPGNALWLISRYPVPRIDTGPGQTVVTTEPFRIPVDSTAWTMIGNPFNFSIALENVSLENGQPLTNLITYDKYWKISSEIQYLRPWEGYMVKSPQPTYLVIQPIAADPFVPAKAIAGAQLERGEWQVQLEASCGDARDPTNFVGVKKAAATTWDVDDWFEPPVIGDHVSLRFPHTDWAKQPDIYTTDFRPAAEDGNYWDFEVVTNYENEPVTLHLARQDSVPENFIIHLVDKRLKTLYNLTENPSVNFASGAADRTHAFRLLIGTAAFIAENNLGAGALPQHFQLYQNFPNPFNSQTLIRFVLPQADEVSLKIYNVLGQEVSSVLNRKRLETGFYEFRWDAAGQPLASGIYLGHLQTKSGHSKIIKMVLTK